MPPVNVLIKPASSACNMACRYCFYRDVSAKRENAFEGMLSFETLEKVVIAAFEYAEDVCSFTFQGGEPTLAGLEFFRRLLRMQERCNKKGVFVRNCIQTNGLAIDAEWAQFLHDNRFLVGLSLDGPAEYHNENRCDFEGKGTWSRVMKTVRLFEEYKVDYNILCVVTGKNARSIGKIYEFYRKNNFRWLQFIPCLEPLGAARGQEAYYLPTKEYGAFLIRVFDLWIADLRRGEYRSIRHLDNWLSMCMGEPPEACNMTGRCAVQFVVEGDGGVYPCDFYVLDGWRIGTVGNESFAEMLESETAKAFIEQSIPIPPECEVCRWRQICRNGCRREREPLPNGTIGRNYYCEAYKAFFSAREQEIGEALAIIRRMRTNG